MPTAFKTSAQQPPTSNPPKTESQAAENYAASSRGIHQPPPHPGFARRRRGPAGRYGGAELRFLLERGKSQDRARPRPGVHDRPVLEPGLASIAATGFGLSALCIAAKRHYLVPSQCEERVERTLAFLLETCPHEHGFLYHFIDIESGQRLFGSELSSIDTALLLCGVLHCRQYFAGNSRIEALATTFYRRIDWQWMLNGGDTLSMGWLPEQGFLKHRWDIYAELTTMYLLAIGSPNHPIPAEMWESVQRPVISYGGIDYISGVAPLFIHQYPQAWCDYRYIRDRHANYFTNSIAATRAHQLWCLVLGQKFPWIDQDMWGISASDSRQGYRVWGGPPSMGPLDGTLVPSAA